MGVAVLRAALGHSDDVDGADAVDQAMDQCQQVLGEHAPQAGILLAGIDYEHDEVIERICSRYPGIQLIGCTTDGDFSSHIPFAEDSINLTLFCSDQVTFSTGYGEDLATDIQGAAQRAVAMATRGVSGPPKLCITTPDFQCPNADTLLKSLNQALGDTKIPIVGGTSADHRQFGTTWQFCNDQVLTNAVPVLLLSGDLQVSCGVASGWKPTGTFLTVSKAEGNVVYTIDGQPALEVYDGLLGGPTPDFPLAVFPDPDAEKFYLRAVFQVDSDTGAITLAGPMPEGSKVRISQALQDDILSGARSSMEQAVEGYAGDTPSVALIFSCGARKWLLGSRVEEEMTTLQEVARGRFPSLDLSISGFYSGGEIAPLQIGRRSMFHNETCVSVLLGTE